MDHGQINHQVSIVSYMFWSTRKTIFWQNKTHLFASLKISSGVGCPTFATEQLEQWITAIFFPKASVHARTQGCLLIHGNYKWTAAFPWFFGDELQRIFQNCLASNYEEGSIRVPPRKNTLKSQKSSNLILLGASSRCPKEMTPETLILSSDPQRLKHVFRKIRFHFSIHVAVRKQTSGYLCRPAHVHVYI